MAAIKRAYSDEDKQQREQKIIEAAQELLMARGFYDINMNDVARAAGLAKGTVYLYFKTKEELFLSVLERQAQAWVEALQADLQALNRPADRESVARMLVQSVATRPHLTRLFAFSPLILEFNVSYERAVSHKQFLANYAVSTGQMIADCLDLSPQQGIQVLLRMYIFISGLEGVAHPSPISKAAMENEMPMLLLDFEEELYALLMLALP